MPRTLTPTEALAHFLGFPPEYAVVIQFPGRAPWHVPPTEDLRRLRFDEVDGNDLVPDDMQAYVRRVPSRGHERRGGLAIAWEMLLKGAPGLKVSSHDRRPGKPEFSDFEVVLPARPVSGRRFRIRKGALGWSNLRDLRQFLREAYPREARLTVTDDAPGKARGLLDARDELGERIRDYFRHHPEGTKGVRVAARAFRSAILAADAAALVADAHALAAAAALLTDDARLYGTLRDICARRRLEDLLDEIETRAQIALEEGPEAATVLPRALRLLVVRSRAARSGGRPVSTSLVVRASRHYKLKPRDTAMLVALEREHMAPLGSSYAEYFASGSEATTAWSKIFYRRR